MMNNTDFRRRPMNETQEHEHHDYKGNRTSWPPSYNNTFFYGVFILTVNNQMADALASALGRSEIEHPVLKSIASELVGTEKDVIDDLPDNDDTVPSYAYQYFRNQGTLFLNKAAAVLLAEAIAGSAGGRKLPPFLWSLYHALLEPKKPHKNCPNCGCSLTAPINAA